MADGPTHYRATDAQGITVQTAGYYRGGPISIAHPDAVRLAVYGGGEYDGEFQIWSIDIDGPGSYDAPEPAAP